MSTMIALLLVLSSLVGCALWICIVRIVVLPLILKIFGIFKPLRQCSQRDFIARLYPVVRTFDNNRFLLFS